MDENDDAATATDGQMDESLVGWLDRCINNNNTIYNIFLIFFGGWQNRVKIYEIYKLYNITKFFVDFHGRF